MDSGVENVPVGQTTPFLSPPQTVGPDPVHDLPAELLQVGWRRFWSKREGRPYFFNKLTNESLWEMPRLSTPAQLAPAFCEHMFEAPLHCTIASRKLTNSALTLVTCSCLCQPPRQRRNHVTQSTFAGVKSRQLDDPRCMNVGLRDFGTMDSTKQTTWLA
ncbi:hypothetical protein HPB50_008212 [Hyalomma asiaticum]|uniref:Uncharacterized protein n=1 Tax=Hyalomma asiaticum TaxID=266040 RepID=A0ACB7TH91_HYAAI|nr:hypothetical protein HPB50_008212 [Hyalomma asiaticum]